MLKTGIGCNGSLPGCKRVVMGEKEEKALEAKRVKNPIRIVVR
jgi:hypothetical protein